ncbi:MULTISPECIES: hypothetical protein [Paenarthrobacter]|uniref:hypothetical protein n=1 Tax=Paenarthrobacter TaxID=1742992 RepID=UPI00142F0971|nr:hypothetical protein [Paenarthrobacter nitroguajacolicus]
MKTLTFTGAAMALVAAIPAFFTNPLVGFMFLATAIAMAATGVVYLRQRQKRESPGRSA